MNSCKTVYDVSPKTTFMKTFIFLIATLFIFYTSTAQQMHATNMTKSQAKSEHFQTLHTEIDPPVYPKPPFPPKP